MSDTPTPASMSAEEIKALRFLAPREPASFRPVVLRLLATIAAKDEEIARLTAERDYFRDMHAGALGDYLAQIDRATAAEAERDRLRQELEGAKLAAKAMADSYAHLETHAKESGS